MRLADYVYRWLADRGVTHAFLVVGGGAMFLNDGLRKESRIKPVCHHHEQAAAMAAEGFARVSGKPGLVCLTTGPGGINALTGIFGAWTDSQPVIAISGQVKRETCMTIYPDLKLRQMGDQEADIIALIKPITKHCALVTDPRDIRYELEKAWQIATTGRPGPVWLDIPLDVQAAEIDPESLFGYDVHPDREQRFGPECREILKRLRESVRPIILAGSGIRSAGRVELFRAIIDILGVPVVLSRSAVDLIPTDHPLYAGRSGIDTDRAGNINLQNSDTLLVLGSRMGVRQVGHNTASYARAAYKIRVDIESDEMRKPGVKFDMPVVADLGVFLDEFANEIRDAEPKRHAGWVNWCRERVRAFPVTLPKAASSKVPIPNPYRFFDEAFRHFADDDIIVCGNGASFIMAAQAARLGPSQRMFFNSGCAAMGYDLPAAIGAAFAGQGSRVICFAGDGSIQMNIQELQTLVHHNLNVKIFVINNGGYLSMRTTQSTFFDGCIGESEESGVSFPDFVGLAEAYGLRARWIDREPLGPKIDEVLSLPGPVLCEVLVDPTQEFEPRMSSKVLPGGEMVSPPLEDMYPFLDRAELQRHMQIPLWEVKS